MIITNEEALALLSYIDKVEAAVREIPAERIGLLFACACLGPKEGVALCHCDKRREGVNSFLRRMAK